MTKKNNLRNVILVTGVGGFIGFHLCLRLLKENFIVVGVDNINDYYDVNLKYSRLKFIENQVETDTQNWNFHRGNLEDYCFLEKIFTKYNPSIVINLAAQAGVRYSLENPMSYVNSNLVGFVNVLELCRKFHIKNFIYASSSSVYGGNVKTPFSEKDTVDHQVSLYAATKKANEVLAHSYSHLYKIPSTGLRFFTVYGPWGRPDMAPMIFAKLILEGKPIKLFNNGDMYRDFTYIDDVIEIILRILFKPAKENKKYDFTNNNPSKSWASHQIFNIGNNNAIPLKEFIDALEKSLNKKAIKQLEPMQLGDVKGTFADNSLIKEYTGFAPKTPLDVGIQKFVDWYTNYY